MSFTVDDLVASLSTNHIGQEAIDLAALQAQLSQSLFTPAQNVFHPKAGQDHCNTPMARTPSASFSWSDRSHSELGCNRSSRSSNVVGVARQRQNSIDEAHAYYWNGDIEETEEDEQMVEDMLCSSSPVFAEQFPTTSGSQFPHRLRSSSATGGYGSRPPSPSPLDNHFTTTDPFYLAQLQQQRQQSQNVLNSSSLFSQLGRPTPHSPFSQPPTQPQYCSHHTQFSAREVDRHSHTRQHSLLVSTSTFDR